MANSYPRFDSLITLRQQAKLNKKARQSLLGICCNSDPKQNSKRILEAAVILYNQCQRVEKSILDCAHAGVDHSHIITTLKGVYQNHKEE